MKKITLLLAVLVGGTVQAQVMAFPPDPIVLCDVNNPGDQMEVFDMTIREDQIINGQTDVVVSYHPTSGDALGNGATIPNPTNFTNEFNPHTIFIRLQSTAGQGWDVTTLELIVPIIPVVAMQPDDIFIDEGDDDGAAVFDLTINESQALGGADPFIFQFEYFETLQDATNNVNEIAVPEGYFNISNPQTIYARMMPLQEDCDFELYDFQISTDGVLGVEEVSAKDFSVFPNPTSGSINIQSPFLISETRVTIYGVGGLRVAEERLMPYQKGFILDIADLKSGLYFLEIASNGNLITKKLIKK